MAESFNHFGTIADALPTILSQIVTTAAKECQKNIQGHIRANGQVRTGFLLNSVYTVTSEGSTYGASVGPRTSSSRGIRKPSARRVRVALAAQKQVAAYLLPEVGGADEATALVAVGANYGVYQNYGTRRMAGKPFFEPGIEQTRPGFEALCSAIETKLREAL